MERPYFLYSNAFTNDCVSKDIEFLLSTVNAFYVLISLLQLRHNTANSSALLFRTNIDDCVRT